MLLLVFWVLNTTFASSQNSPIKALADSTQIQIGSQFQVLLSAKVDYRAKVVFPEQPVFGRLEVVESSMVDTIKNQEDQTKIELIKKYTLTQFDTGYYVIPSFRVLIDNKPYLSDSLSVQVTGVEVDTLRQNLYDIKDFVADSDSSDSSMLKWMFILLMLSALVGFVVAYLMVRKKKIREQNQEQFTPIQKATNSLKELEKRDFTGSDAVKEYYSQLTDIIKIYLEEAVKFPALENTTQELITNLKNKALDYKITLSDKVITDLQTVLEDADLVKFAKLKPEQNKIITHSIIIHNTINAIDEVFPDKTPEELELERNEELQKAFERKQKNKQMRSRVTFAAAIVCTIGLAYWVATSGIYIVKDYFTGSATSKYLNSEWIISKYGDYPMSIETPEVLVRTQDTITMDAYMIKEMNIAQFRFKAPDNSLFIGLDNIKDDKSFFSKAVADLLQAEGIVEFMIDRLGKAGYKNIIMEQQQLDTEQGIEGVKCFGTMTHVDSELKKTQKMYYEIIVFKYKGTIHQLMVYMPESDPNTKYIVDRIVNSIKIEFTN
ncbi:MAG: hypothetical protein Q4B43_04775 [Bacteroidota bacterium]|nr:hypothetical protein [Bacteroidota bacterium]